VGLLYNRRPTSTNQGDVFMVRFEATLTDSGGIRWHVVSTVNPAFQGDCAMIGNMR
jgi:hypothetical protein